MSPLYSHLISPIETEHNSTTAMLGYQVHPHHPEEIKKIIKVGNNMPE